MTRSIQSIITGVALMICLTLSVSATNQVATMDINAVVTENGSLHITQIWEGEFDDGTELYIPINTHDIITISALEVSDQNGTYAADLDWDVDRSFEEKARKYGINETSDGFEICFGISQYGKNRYTISYTLDNVVGGYLDRDGVNFRFVNDGMNTTPTDVTLAIELANATPITDEIADVWGFGFGGEIGFENGRIVAYSTQSITQDDHVTVMFSLDKGIIEPSRQENSSFEEVMNRAFEGSDYDGAEEELSPFAVIIIAILSFVLPIGLVVFIVRFSNKRKKKKMNQLAERFGYFRDIPNGGNLSGTYVLGKSFEICEDGVVLATGMLRLIQLGCLVPETEQTVGFMGKAEETVNLRLAGGNQREMNEYDEYLYTVLEAAAGPDLILQPNELGKFADQNEKLLSAYLKKHDTAGRLYLNQKQTFKRWTQAPKLTDLTVNGEKELGELLGFKKYLEDFSLIAERGVNEIAIWQELLTYAMLLGIADQVAEQMRALYPSLSTQLDSYTTSMSTAHSYRYILYSNIQRAQQREQEARSGGSGGFTSFGGGGGSIGGGSGGGSR